MRHLIDTYIEADEPRKISPFDNMGLLELIVKTGIANAIATQLGGLKGNKNAIAETIENNVRSKIIKEHLNDPAFYEKMSALLDEIIAARKAKAIEYEEYLKRIAELAKKVEAGQAEETPENAGHARQAGPLQQSRARTKTLALRIDDAVRRVRPDGWRGVQAREQVIKAALYGVLQDVAEVERIFLIIKAQSGILMVTTIQAWRHLGGCGAQGHQERPPERLSADRAGAHFRPAAHEPRHHPAVRHFETRLDQAAADASCANRNAKRRANSGPRKPLRLGKALPAEPSLRLTLRRRDSN